MIDTIIINETNFLTVFVSWFQHKIILYERTKFCLAKIRKNAQIEANQVFKNYLLNITIGNKYDLATKILKFEKTLQFLLPSDLNTSYESSKIILNECVNFSKKILNKEKLTV